MASGKRTSRSITALYLERLAAIDGTGPALRAVITVNPDALAAASALDAERAAGRVRGPLHGVPVLVKDNIDTADKMPTTAGSLALGNSRARQDATVVARLRDAGAVILAKANLSEWANFRSSRSSSGWSARGGQCRNPYALDRNPCGSSSGSGAGVSANLAALAVGTETNGSIVCPASKNGIVGIKPTVGLVSRAGIIPISSTQDTAGPMARTVRDAAILLGAMAGVDPRDPATAASAGKSPGDYTRFLDADGLRGARLGIARKFFGFSEAVDEILEDALAEMKRRGAELIDPADLPTHGRLGKPEWTVLLYEFKAGINEYLAGLGEGVPVKSLEQLITFNEAHREEELKFFGQDRFIEAEAKGPLTAPEYLAALEESRRLSRTEGIDAVMDRHRLDAIVAPTGGPAWAIDLVLGDRLAGGSSAPAAVAGYPAITVPVGHVQGLPIGVSFYGRAWSEPALIRIAYAFEQATRARRPPRFLPAVDAGAPAARSF